MPEYRVTATIEVYADDPDDAMQIAAETITLGSEYPAWNVTLLDEDNNA